MIGRVEFALIGAQGGTVRPYEDYGMYLVSYDAPPPKPKTYTVQIEGRSGLIDLTEWAGGVFYEDRNVTIRLRDMNGDASELITRLNGRRVRVYLDDFPNWYFVGRVERINEQTRQHVTDLTIQITCDPWKYPCVPDATGQYANTGNLPYSGYYNLGEIVENGEYVEWAFELYQNASQIELTISSEFDSANEVSGSESKVVVNGVETIIENSGTMTLTTPLIKGPNTIAVYNNQTGNVDFTASVKFANGVM